MNDALVAPQDKSCCPPDSLPHLPEDPNYVVKGKMVKYEGVEAYVSGEGSRCIVLIHDIFGLHNGHNKKICDMLAEKLRDTVVIAPDFFPDGMLLGDRKPPESFCLLVLTFLCCCILCKFGDFKKKYPWDDKVKTMFDKTTTYMISQGVGKFGMLSFCWGAYVSFNACVSALHKDKLLCSMNCHPSLDGIAGASHLDIVRGVSCPQLIAATPQESAAYKPNGEVQRILGEKPFGADCEFYLYSKQSHGFVARGDLKNETTKNDMYDALDKSMRFFEKFTS